MLITLTTWTLSQGGQAIMRDTVWAGRIQKMVNANGVTKGVKQVLEERGINTGTLKGPDMIICRTMMTLGQRRLLSKTFSLVEGIIERVWGKAKQQTYFWKSCDYKKANREGHTAGKIVEQAGKKYKSHHRIFFQDNIWGSPRNALFI